MEKTLYSVQEAAEFCGVTRMTIFRWIKAGTIKAETVGRTSIIPFSEIKDRKKEESVTQGSLQLSTLIRPILQSHGIVRAGLFGSAARGELHNDSDVDIVIDTGGKMNLFEIIGLKQLLERKLRREVDLVEYDAIKPALRAHIMRDHVSIV